MSGNNIQGSGAVPGHGLVPGHGFKPGKSGNPGGLPKWVKQVRESLRSLAPKGQAVVAKIFARALDTERLEKIVAAEESTPEQVLKAEQSLHARLDLANRANAEILKYVLPKPTQRHKVEGQVQAGPLAGVPADELAAFIRQVRDGKAT